ncbi:ParB family protein [Saccharothrix isguenensis]
MTQPPEAVPEPAAGVNEITVSVTVADNDQVTGADRQTGRRVQRTVNFDQDVLERARAAATYLAAYEAEAGVRSLADIVNPAVEAYVADLERRYNDGEAFRPVFRMPPGRPSRRT